MGWSNVLDNFGVEYLHMKEIRDPNGAYASFTDDKYEEFFLSLINVIDAFGP